MSGEFYEVLGEGRFLPSAVCPETWRGLQVSLRPADGEAVQVSAEVACVAAGVKRRLLENGPEAEVSLPVKKATLSKVLEYMKHHSTTPPGDIKTPLISDSIAECGASRWDAKFISVDRPMLVELLYASNALDIPTLNLLAKAKASTMMFGKSPDQIRKDFNFTNDLPQSEEGDILRMVQDMRRHRKLPFDEDVGIAPTTALLGSVWRLAEAHSASEERQPPTPAAAGERGSWRQGSWRAAVVEDWRQLEHAPPEVCADRELLLAALAPSQGVALRWAAPELRGDRDLVLAAVAAGGGSLAHASDELRADRAFVLEALRLDGAALLGASAPLRADRALVLEAARLGRGSALGGAEEALRRDADFALEVAAEDPEALLYVADGLRDDKDFAVRAAGSVAGALRRLPMRLRADREVVEAALSRDPFSVPWAHAARRAELEWQRVETAEWSELEYQGGRQAGVPLSLEAARQGYQFPTAKLQKSVLFTAMSTITPNMGQSNYIAANAFLDKLAPYERPEIDAVGLMWGTVGGMGMRWKAFASQDFMLQTPDLLMLPDDCCKVLHIVTTKMQCPEWFAANFIPMEIRNAISEQASKVGGFVPSEDLYTYPSIPKGPQALRREEPRLGAQPLDGAVAPGGRGLAASGAARDDGVPLGGWPSLAERRVGGEVRGPPPRAQKLELVEGARVELVGLKSKSGVRGIVVKCFPEGRYKVALEGVQGSALLKPEYLQVIAPPA
mmetsp:Transcript_67677/g.220313  ORF Transcript_67677/g.220313 Transcript_67677/m.220313 type:complete len:733 (+) Transcript_67677:85-2283(+)|eukprot:CAMPEP_0203870654 /NCGR_PEP_ID=MMETSP0359-20131031/18343_1 /ASSEMBLY_ACC=CAM_ASM_000338 /TAXON_ID=268821 /ORGANISM="Scrippsiella Hangoei, Strain SHTV-5" /LENGTH=732 /DNA_ID=CAMNT_0050789323 /DNA_START=83 /DNA_END=2281 /DNA_ORIENTATION=-